jgi:6-phosphofructokinase 1
MNNVGMDALVVIGGDGSLNGASKLAERGISIMGIPASIDNDIYGSDMCIGVDTALNTIVDAIDKIRDTASSHNRAFLVETMGRMSGYLAVQAGIVTGAELILIPEVATPIEDVLKVIDSAYRKGKTHCIIVIAEGAVPHTTELAEAIDHMELGFNTRVTILGHVQRGGKPTAFDRMLSSRFGTKAVEYLARRGKQRDGRSERPGNALRSHSRCCHSPAHSAHGILRNGPHALPSNEKKRGQT